MPVVGFLEIDGIPGDSKIKGFEDQIEVVWWGYNISRRSFPPRIFDYR
jgi:type VI protein secretion system component Hcp